MNATVTCEKCGKPLGVFDGNICNECENKNALGKIRDEIEQMRAKPDNMVKLIGDFISIDYVFDVINKYMEDKK